MGRSRKGAQDGVLVPGLKWKKGTSGDWMVENTGIPARIGEVIAVTRRSGGIDRLVVRKVIWQGHGIQWLKATRATKAEGGPTYRGRGVTSSP